MILMLRKAVQAYLLSHHPRVYFRNDIPKDAKFPYLVYDFHPTFTLDESSERLLIDIDAWDKPSNGDSTQIETLIESVNGNGDLSNPTGLNFKTISNEDVMATFRLESRNIIDDDDPKILRRKYTYATVVYERSS
ncbi:MAG: hypothetical protein JXR88_12545 [Clostridia bacterium]|nr:hypothetical protein [Clostridia bacterium]